MANWTPSEKKILSDSEKIFLKYGEKEGLYQLEKLLPQKSHASIDHKTRGLRSHLFSTLKKEKEGEVMKDKNLVDAQKFAKEILAGLEGQKPILYLPRKKKIFSGKIIESAALMLSDIHCGQVNKFPDKNGKMQITYDTEIMVQEFDRLLDGVFTVNTLLSTSYHIKKLYIFGVGDYMENDVIFKGQRFFIDKSVGQQLKTLVNVFSSFLLRCAEMFDEVEFICVAGNHGRFQMGRDAAPIDNNWDNLFGWMMEIMFRGNERIKITVPETWFYLAEVYGWKYFLHHGDTVYSWMNIPYYGLKRQGTARRIEMPFDIECIGHFHHRMEIPISGESITLVNGGWISKSDFGWRKFGVLSKPEQIYFGISPKRARSWCFNLDLLHSKHELKKLLKEAKGGKS